MDIDIHIKIKIPEILISKSKIGRVYGWKPPTPDDIKRYAFLYPLKTFTLKSDGRSDPLPKSVDLRSGPYKMPPVYDQKSCGSCVANVIAAILEFNELNRPSIGEDPKNSDAVSAMRPSRLFIYYFGRLRSGITKIDEDSGMMIYDGVGAASLVGYCPEEVPTWNVHKIPENVCWPYDVDKFAEKPPMKSILFARKHKGVNARRIDGTNLFQLKSALAKGYPIAFGMILFESFESEELRKTGIMKMPDVEKEGIIGGHAVCLTHYDDTKKIGDETGAFGVRNSWGSENWGDGGYFWSSYSVITNPNICMDFWIIPENKNNY
jgi:C1A family cysteine protease